MHEAVIVNRGFQLLNTLHFNHQIKCVTQQASDAVAVHYTVGSEHVTSVCPFKPHEPQHKHTVSEGISEFIYVRKYRLYVASCPDLTLRVFSEHFELIQTVHTTATILSFSFNEATSELYSGGVGCINTWQLRHQLHHPLVPGNAFTCSVGKQQWVVSLEFDVSTEKLVVACQDTIYIIDAQTHKQTDAFSNGHKASITSAILYPQMEYLITAAKDGTIKVWNCILHSEVHTFAGHLKAITGLKPHPLAPCVISCSMDGTIRMWHLECMTECYRLDCGEELLGMSSDLPFGNRMVCYSHQNAKMWAIHQLEACFASVNSHVVGLTRLEVKGVRSHPARILALAEDGGVRLLSPVTGEVITILFPMFSSQMLHEVACSLQDGLMFALLRTGEALVFTTHTSPCMARELWVPRGKDRINCIALCTITAENRAPQSFVFGGQSCGHISLLYANGFSMPHPCPAHAGHVIKLTSSANPVTPSESHPALVSYGSDNTLNVWALEVRKEGFVSLQILMCINMEPCPCHVALLHSTLCLALASNRIIQLSVPSNRRVDSQPLSNLPLLTHQREDDHIDTITSLSCVPFLELFASSSSDGHVKIWSSDNQLVSDIQFGATLASVGFANPRGDLLVGFQKHICIVNAEDYLPAPYVDMGKKCLHWDRVEEPLPFDPALEFWYDPARVPSMPAQQEKRKKVAAEKPQFPRPHVANLKEEAATQDTGCFLSNASVASMENLQSGHMIDSSLARKLSQEYFASLKGQVSRERSTKQLTPLGFSEDCSGTNLSDQGSSWQRHHSSLLTTIAEHPENQCTTHTPVGGPSSSNGSLPKVKSAKSTVQPPAAEVMPLHSASKKFPIAPDCLVPNSVIRTQIGYVPPEVIIRAPKPKPMKTAPSAVSGLCKVRKEKEPKIPEKKPANDEEEKEVVTCVSEFLEFDPAPTKPPRDESLISQNLPTSPPPPSKEDGEPAVSVVASVRPVFTSAQRRGNTGIQKEAKPKVVILTQFEPPLDQQMDRRSSLHSQGGRRSTSGSSRLTSQPCSPSRRASLSRASLSPRKSSRDHSACFDGSVIPIQRSLSTTSSNVEGGGVSQRSSITPHRPTSSVQVSDMDDLALLLQRISSNPWFPRRTSCSGPSLKAVFEVLMSLLLISQKPVFCEVCNALLELKEVSALTDNQLLAVVHQLLARLKRRASGVKVTTLKTLELLGLGGKEVVLAILPMLVDPDPQVCNAAFCALEKITGIIKRSQLHQLLIEMDLLQNVVADENEILRDLAARIKNGQSEASSRSLLLPTPVESTPQSLMSSTQHVKETSPKKESPLLLKYPRGVPPKQQIPKGGSQRKYQTRRRKEDSGCGSANGPEGATEKGLGSYSVLLQPHQNYKELRISVHQNLHLHDKMYSFTDSASTTSKLYKLIAHNPAAFSQTEPAISMMLDAYSSNKTEGHVDEYAWSEVFPIIRAARRWSGDHMRRKRSVSLPSKLVLSLPKLDATEVQRSSESGTQKPADVVVQLPRINVSRLTLA